MMVMMVPTASQQIRIVHRITLMFGARQHIPCCFVMITHHISVRMVKIRFTSGV